MKRPDWTNLKCYSTALSPQGWAWEFLRRNKHYRDDWKRWSRFVKRWGTDEDAYNRCPFTEGWECDPPAKKGETHEKYRERVSDAAAQMWPLAYLIRTRWGLLFDPIDPDRVADASTKFILETPTERIRVWGGWNFKRIDQPLAPTEMAMIIDMALPLTPQMAQLRRHLRERQCDLVDEGKFKARIDAPRYSSAHLRTYLRILDARSAGAKPAEIIKTLYAREYKAFPAYGGRKNFANAEHIAKNLRDGGYRELVQLRPEKISAP
jgi:Uncharacterized conserved protein (DUF2285)/Family of unknown function (DUF6499)